MVLEPAIEREKNASVVDIERSYAIRAAIVLVMKSRRVLHFKELLEECTTQLSPTFHLIVVAFKMLVERLMSHEYIELDEGDKNVFKYLM
ncbi:hypothetical protein RJ639_028990 [Escallonia herrerae]|uniref:Cullin neddylation domain-containing protein n=1 Tax=Escallonia herrerae TaxID=1293975 RepID=A0AA89BED4_9ASTE|nr:hypothetical protein RJ639_028990 [Escallonia herrerae]